MRLSKDAQIQIFSGQLSGDERCISGKYNSAKTMWKLKQVFVDKEPSCSGTPSLDK